MNKAESITPDDILYWKKNGVKIAYWYGDMRDDIADYVSNKLKYIDLFLTNSDDKKYIEKISSLGIEKNKIFFSHTATDLRDRKSTRLNSSHIPLSRMPSSA